MINVPSFKTGCQQIAQILRNGWDESGCVESARLLSALIPVLSALPPLLQQRCVQISSAILACQERHDWLGLADYLEYELVELLDELDAWQHSL
ncbi:MAG: hypothetical protein ACRCRW_16195 [Aeromonadaceae bacterium]